MLKEYYYLTKPGIIRGNIMIAAATFIYASQGSYDLNVFLGLIFGTSMVIASSCVFNNYIDVHIDSKMSRTKKRALVTGKINNRDALIFGGILGITGLLILWMFTNTLTIIIGLIGMFFYVIVYGYFKRSSVHGTIIGSISGALPPVAGYVSVTNQLNTTAALLFLCLVFWQMPHFYAIAMYRIKDYQKANLPVLPIIKGIQATRVQMIVYILGLLICCAVMTAFGYTGLSFLVIMTLTTTYWLILGFRGLRAADNVAWATGMFRVSLVVLLSFALMLSLDNWLA